MYLFLLRCVVFCWLINLKVNNIFQVKIHNTHTHTHTIIVMNDLRWHQFILYVFWVCLCRLYVICCFFVFFFIQLLKWIFLLCFLKVWIQKKLQFFICLYLHRMLLIYFRKSVLFIFLFVSKTNFILSEWMEYGQALFCQVSSISFFCFNLYMEYIKWWC